MAVPYTCTFFHSMDQIDNIIDIFVKISYYLVTLEPTLCSLQEGLVDLHAVSFYL